MRSARKALKLQNAEKHFITIHIGIILERCQTDMQTETTFQRTRNKITPDPS